MLDHQRAMDELLLSLVIPSSTLWETGAVRLHQSPPIRANDLPPDPKLRRGIEQADARVHELADRARRATTSPERASVYAELLATCATCHSLHQSIWGPS